MKNENKYIEIVECRRTGKTRIFDVMNKSGDYPIGDISWYSNWRQYCFFPEKDEELVFNSECLELIVNFLKEINIEHRKNWKQKIQKP